MLPYRAVILAIACISSPAWAFEKPAATGAPQVGDAKAEPNELVPRQPLPKVAYVSKPLGESRLVVKFRDDVKARAQADKSVKLTAAPTDSASLNTITQQFNLKFESATKVAESKLAALEARVAAYSGRAQPDLAGMMYVDGPQDKLEAAANALQNLDVLEFAYFQVPWVPFQEFQQAAPPAQEGIEPTGACCLPAAPPDPTCDDATFNTQALCDFVGGVFFEGATCALLPTGCPAYGACCTYQSETGEWGCSATFQDAPPTSTAVTCADLGGVWAGGECEDADCGDFDCGSEELESCFIEHAYPWCNDEDCCTLVLSHRPECGTEEWDYICVALANFYCVTPPGEPDRCITPLNTSCFIPHEHGGCIDSDCCHDVCDLDPFCCTGNWDAVCVSYAYQICTHPDGGDTPDLTSAQGYLRLSSYEAQFQGPPPPVIPPLPPPPPTYFAGYAGEGMNLFAEGPLVGDKVRWIDDPNMPDAERYQGLYGLGRELNEVYGVGSGNWSRGETIKVAVIEWAFYQGHEDLDVISEPGQTLIVIPDITWPDHATACLGIINAKDNGFGMVGIAPDAQAYFFPLTSVEEGPRQFAAFVNCVDTLDPGDVISCSFGPGAPYYNLCNEPGSFMLIRMAADLGITPCIAAGNSCFNLDDAPDQGESGAIVVGAGTPGAPYCREEFSNYCRSAQIDQSNCVHMSAWGTRVAATGYGDLFWGGSPNSSYTHFFNGTSAATPQIAGAAACLQGLAKQFFGIPLATPYENGPANNIRAAMRAGGAPQCGAGDNSQNLPGFSPEVPCGVDIDPDSPGNRIGPYIRPRQAFAAVINQPPIGFDASPNLKNVFILRGVPGFGNVFSLKNSDNSYFILRSLFTDRNHVPALSTHSAEVNHVSAKAKYLATGYHADLLFQAKAPSKQAGSMVAMIELQTDAQFSMLMVEAFDWQADKWTFIGIEYPIASVPQGGEAFVAFASSPGTKFIHPSSLNTYLRAYVLTLGSPTPGFVGAGSNPEIGAVMRFDWVNVLYSTGFGQPVP